MNRQLARIQIDLSVASLAHDQQRPRQNARLQGPDDRGLFPRRRADLLADPGVEARLRLGRPAVVVHGHADVVRLAHAHGPPGVAAGLRRAAADDEDGAARDLLARGRHRPGAADPPPLQPHRPRPAALRIDPHAARRRDRAIARTGRHRLRHQAHGPLAGLRGLAAAAEAAAGVRRPGRRANPRPPPRRDGSHRRGPHSAAGISGRQRARRASTPARRCSRPRRSSWS